MFAASCFIVARFSETGALGCVHYGAYYKWYEDVQAAFLEKYSLSIQTLKDAKAQLLPIEMNSRFFRPVYAGDELEIGMCVRKVSSIKAEVDFTVTRVSDSMKVAQCNAVYACTDESGRPLLLGAVPKLYQALKQAMLEQQS